MSDQKSMAFKPPRPRVLYVDDQVGNLTVFRASVRRFADVKTVSSGEEALWNALTAGQGTYDEEVPLQPEDDLLMAV